MSTPFFSQTVFSPWLTPVRLASTSNIVGLYYNGLNNNGVGATLTVAASSLTVDSVVCHVGDRLLLAGQTLSYENGVYVVLSIESTVVLQRAADQQSLEQIQPGQYMSVAAGSLNGGNIYTILEPKPNQLGVSPVVVDAVPSSGGGSGTVGAGTTGQISQYPANGTAVVGASLVAGSNVSIVNNPGTITISASGGSGGVNAGLQNQLAYYAANGSTVSGLTTANNSVLITNGGGIPSLSATLPSAVQLGINQVGTLTSGVWNATTVDVAHGGTGDTAFIPYSVICGGTSSTSAFQNVNPIGNSGEVLTSQGPGALPQWAAAPGGGGVNAGLAGEVTFYAAAGSQVSGLTAGTTGQALLSQGVGVAPAWGDVATVTNPTVMDRIATYTNSTGGLGDSPTIAYTTGGIQAGTDIVAGNNIIGTLQVRSGGDVIAGQSGFQGGFVSFPATGLRGSLALRCLNNAGNFNLTISNASCAQNTIFSIPDPSSSTANFILDKSSTTQFINSALDVTSGNLSVGFNGQQGNLNVYAPGNNLGSMAIIPANNSGNFNITLTNDPFGQISTIALPDPGVSNAHFILDSATSAQFINSPIAFLNGSVESGVSGTAGYFRAFPPTAGVGNFTFFASDNLGDYAIGLTNSAMGQDTVISIPDPGAATAKFILDTSPTNQVVNSGGFYVAEGDLQAGANGTLGSLKLYAPGVGLGSMSMQGSNNAGNFDVLVTNDDFAANCQINIPDAGDPNQAFAVFPITSPPVAGRLVQVTGARGVVQDAGFAMKQVQAAAAAGGSATQNFVDAFCTATSVVVGNWVTQANPAQVMTIVPNNGSFDVTSTADAGAGTFSYIVTK